MCSGNNEIAGFQNFAKSFSMPAEFGQIEIFPDSSGSLDLSAGIEKKMAYVYAAAAEKRGITPDEVKDEVESIVDETREFARRINNILEELRSDSPKTSEDREKFREILEDGVSTIREMHSKMESALCIAKGDNNND